MGAFGIMVLLAGVAYQGVLQGPPTVLAANASTGEVAAYAVPALVMTQLVSIATSSSLGFLTFASGETTAPDRTHLAAVYQSNLRMTLLVVGLPIAYLATFAHTLLRAWIGTHFADTFVQPLQYLALAGLVLALSSARRRVACVRAPGARRRSIPPWERRSPSADRSSSSACMVRLERRPPSVPRCW